MNSSLRVAQPEVQWAVCEPAKILVLEDEERMRWLVRDMLAGLGHRVWMAETLEAARKTIQHEGIDLVLADIHLHGRESGIDLLHELAPRSPDLAVVMMTGSTALEHAIECLRDGAFDYLLKPFRVPDMSATVARALQRQRKMLSERGRVEEQLRVLGRFPAENPNPVLRVSKEGLILYANEASAPLLQRLQCQVGRPLPAFLGQFVADALEKGQRRDIEVDGAGRFFSFAVTPIKDADYVYLYGHDITSLKETERILIRIKDQAREMALHDALTGLPNRTLLEDRLQQAIAQCERSRRKLAVVFLDLDNFKQVNDTHGHRSGDALLVTLARHLRQALRKTDTVARWGGDEMVLLLPDIRNNHEARTVCQRIKAQVQQRLAREHPQFSLGLSLGVAIYPDDAELPELLLQQADTALYLAKFCGRDEVVLYAQTDAIQTVRQRANLRALFREAVAGQHIQVHYQPIIDASNGQPVAVEALARWFDESLGWIAPGTFIPLAEHMGLIDALGSQVQEKALAQLSRWRDLGLSLSLSLNLSLRQLLRPDFLQELLEQTARFGIPAPQVVLELTESQALLGLVSEKRRLEELSQSGFGLAIDDFGQGHSSLSSLHDMPVDELKIDARFVRHLQTEKGRRIVQAIVELARTLGLRTVAEGVETGEEAAALIEMGLDRLQGYYFARPMPAEDLQPFLQGRSAAAL